MITLVIGHTTGSIVYYPIGVGFGILIVLFFIRSSLIHKRDQEFKDLNIRATKLAKLAIKLSKEASLTDEVKMSVNSCVHDLAGHLNAQHTTLKQLKGSYEKLESAYNKALNKPDETPKDSPDKKNSGSGAATASSGWGLLIFWLIVIAIGVVSFNKWSDWFPPEEEVFSGRPQASKDGSLILYMEPGYAYTATATGTWRFPADDWATDLESDFPWSTHNCSSGWNIPSKVMDYAYKDEPWGDVYDLNRPLGLSIFLVGDDDTKKHFSAISSYEPREKEALKFSANFYRKDSYFDEIKSKCDVIVTRKKIR